MNKKTAGYLLLVFALLLQMAVLPIQTKAAGAGKATASVNYLALGDSLAFGIDPNGKPGKGYADFLAEKLAAGEALQTSNKGFSYPGYTSGNVLEDLKNDVTKPILGTGFTDKEASIRQAVKDADLITLTAGANDVLPFFKIDKTTGAADVDLAKVQAAITQAGGNIQQTLKQIYELNPDAQVYVMGYYNPFPYADAKLQPQLTQLLKGLNGALQAGMTGTPAIFVKTDEIIAADFKNNLPNPENIHLSQAGYQVVADAFYQSILANTPEAPPEPTAMFTDISNSWAKDYIEAAAAQGFVGGYPDHTFRPKQTLTRAQAASIVVRALDLKPKTNKMPFDDVSLYADSTKADIQAAYDHGLMSGKNGHFMPNEAITRAQLALLLSRSYEVAKGSPFKPATEAPFKDIRNFSKDTQWAIAGLYQLGITSGDNGKFLPNDPTTRAHAAKMIVNSMKAMAQ